jgi:hypothetical protein
MIAVIVFAEVLGIISYFSRIIKIARIKINKIKRIIVTFSVCLSLIINSP